jgi:hypothetical protein
LEITLQLPDRDPLDEFRLAVEQRRRAALARIASIPIAALIWGPAPNGDSPIGDVRRQLRDRIRADGHIADFSEELVDPCLPYSIQAQQLSQVDAYDITFSLPASPGSIAEIHDFFRLPRFSHKVVAFLDRAYDHGYANRTLLEIESTVTCRIVPYDANDLPMCIIDRATQIIRSIQELKYATSWP